MTVEHIVTSLVVGVVVLVVTYVALKLVYAIGDAVQRMLVEIFDVRGHRDAVGPAASRHADTCSGTTTVDIATARGWFRASTSFALMQDMRGRRCVCA